MSSAEAGDPDPLADEDQDEDDATPALRVWAVGEEGAAEPRLDVFLVERLRGEGCSRTQIQGWIDAGRVRVVRGAREEAAPPRAWKLRPGDEVTLRPPPPPPPPLPLQAEDLPLTLLYQDEAILVVDKPAGMAVHPGAGIREGTLAGALLHASPGRLSSLGGPERPGIVHRLDKDTSGVMVVARTDTAHRHLARQFHDRLVEKTYLALVQGRPPEEGRIDRPIGRNPKDRKKMAVVPGGRAARTAYRLLERLRGGRALVEARPETGRTHQIRVHLQAIGCPLLADASYGRPPPFTSEDAGLPGPAQVLLARHALHAAALVLTHPVSGARLRFEAPLPPDLAETLAALRRR